MGSVSLVGVVNKLNDFMNGDTTGHLVGEKTEEKPCGNPEKDGIVFYMLNHAVSVVRQKVHPFERLGKYMPILDLYHHQLAYRSASMFFYMLLICTRESRHAKDDHNGPVWQELRQKYGEEVFQFHKTIKGTGSGGAADRFKANPPATTLGNYTTFLSDVFYKGWYSGGYGGPAWGEVADVLRDYVNGTITAEMMMDTAFTLCHNNGPIFNKGMLFDSYSDEIYKILDVQRSGQIPQMVANNESKFSSDKLIRTYWQACRDIIGEGFEGHVDWFLVEELGAMKTYKHLKDAQVQKYGYPTKFKAKVEAEKIKKDFAAKKQAEEAKMWVEIMPGLKVKKVEIKR